MDGAARHERALMAYAVESLRAIDGVTVIGAPRDRAGALSFVLAGRSTAEVGTALDRRGIAVRAGHHCAQPALRRFGQETTVRPSFALYNTPADIDVLVAALQEMAAGPAR